MLTILIKLYLKKKRKKEGDESATPAEAPKAEAPKAEAPKAEAP